jgi:hypothetical protein
MHTHTSKAAVSKTPATHSGAPSTKSVESSTRSLPENGSGSLKLAGLSVDPTMAMELRASRMLRHTGSKLLALLSKKSTFSGMSTRTSKPHLALVSLTVTEMPFMINRTVSCYHRRWLDVSSCYFLIACVLNSLCYHTSLETFISKLVQELNTLYRMSTKFQVFQSVSRVHLLIAYCN